MTSFVLVPGAGGRAWLWHRAVAELLGRGHQVVAVELPGADPAAGLDEYRDLIVAAAGEVDPPIVIVAQSLAGFSAPLACDRLEVERLVLLNAMIPRPGETAGQWWSAVGWRAAADAKARADGRPPPDLADTETLFLHDLSDDVVEAMRSDPADVAEADKVFGEPWPLKSWPDVPTSVLAGREDRLFPVDLQRRVAGERLNLDVEELPGGHLLALSQAAVLADRLSRGG